jgi:hypothetical protein
MSELKPPFTVICIDDKARPKEIPTSKWVKRMNEYTVIKVGRTLDNQIGFVLEEIELGEDTFPYDLFSAKRFGLLQQNPVTAEETAEDAVDELVTETLG